MYKYWYCRIKDFDDKFRERAGSATFNIFTLLIKSNVQQLKEEDYDTSEKHLCVDVRGRNKSMHKLTQPLLPAN